MSIAMIYSSIVAATAVFVSGLSSSVAYTDRALEDKITDLPGSEGLDITFNQFSGVVIIAYPFIVYDEILVFNNQ